MALKYPLGIQTFERLINEGYVYVDKTRLIYDLVHGSTYYFLSRPRRFGKSLLVSTLDAYFSGCKELFQGLAIEKLESEWKKYPVLRIDLNTADYSQDISSLVNILSWHLREWEKKFNLNPTTDADPGTWFGSVIEQIYQKTGKQVVILVDEYDKPLIANIERDKWDLQEKMRNILKAFYGNVKTMDPYIRFAMFTGVSRFSHVSIFSDLNNLNDISLDRQYSTLCGISNDELHHYFDEGVEEMAQTCNMTKDEVYDKLKLMYDGFCFSDNGEAIYNPWSLLSALSGKRFGAFWYGSGTPTFLIKLIKDHQLDLTQFDHKIEADESTMITYENDDNIIAPLYQTGYLTIKNYDPQFGTYMLGFPNMEVTKAFNANLLPSYSHVSRMQIASLGATIARSAVAGNIDLLLTTLKGILAEAPVESNDERVLELNYRNLIAIALRMSGLQVHIEQPTSAGRIDLALEAGDYVYIMEFKRTTIEAAALQIESRHYGDRYINDPRNVIKIAIALEDNIKNIASWSVID